MGGKTKQSTVNPVATQQYQNARSALGNAQYKPVTGADIQQYINPYTTNVIDNAMSDLGRYRTQALNSNADRANAAGAFGGSRHGVLDAMTQSEFDRNAASLATGLRGSAYDNALGVATGQNAAANQYPLAIQQLLAQMAANTGSTTTQSQSPGLGQILGGIGSAAQGGAALLALSDERLKRDIKPIGERNGRKWYSFRYLWSDDLHEGVMAQENMDVAVMGADGFYSVDYGAV